MGIDGNSIAAATTGFSQGLDQGFDLVNKYQQIQERNDKRRKQQIVEQGAMQIAQEGLFQKDPELALGKTRDLYLQVGDLEGANKYQENLVAMREANKKKTVGEAFERSQIGDIEGAVELLNQVYAKDGGGKTLAYAKSPDGKPTLTTTQNGKPFAKTYDDPMEFQADFAEQIAYLAMGPGEALEAQREERQVASGEAKDKAAIEASRAATESENQLRDEREGLLRAQTEGAIASGQAARASASADVTRANTEKTLAPYRQREAIATTGLKEQELQNANARDMAGYLQDNPPGGDAIMTTEGPPPLHHDAGAVGELGLAIQKSSGTDTVASANQAKEILEKATDVNDAGDAVFIGGNWVVIGKEAAKTLERQLTSRQAAIPEAE